MSAIDLRVVGTAPQSSHVAETGTFEGDATVLEPGLCVQKIDEWTVSIAPPNGAAFGVTTVGCRGSKIWNIFNPANGASVLCQTAEVPPLPVGTPVVVGSGGQVVQAGAVDRWEIGVTTSYIKPVDLCGTTRNCVEVALHKQPVFYAAAVVPPMAPTKKNKKEILSEVKND